MLHHKLIATGRNLIIFLALLAGVASLQLSRLQTLQRPGGDYAQFEIDSQVRLDQLRLQLLRQLPSLGFCNLIADWTFLGFLQYFGNTELRERNNYRLSPAYFEVIIDRDPWFLRPYIFLSNIVSMYAGRPDLTVALMAQGLQHMTPTLPPRSYFVWRYKGIDELLFLGDGMAAQQSFEMAADWARQSPDPESDAIAQVSQQTAQFLAQNPVSREAQIGAWAEVYLRAVDDKGRQIAREKIEALGGEIVVSEGGRVSVRYRASESQGPQDSR